MKTVTGAANKRRVGMGVQERREVMLGART